LPTRLDVHACVGKIARKRYEAISRRRFCPPYGIARWSPRDRWL